MSNSPNPSADLPPDVQSALDRLAHYYNGNAPWDPNKNPGGMRNGGHRRNFTPALQDAVTAINGIVALMLGAIAIGNDVTSTAAIAQPLLDQAVARLQDALHAVDDAEAARDRAEYASGVVTGDFIAKLKGTLVGMPLQPPDAPGEPWLAMGADGGSGQLMITTSAFQGDAPSIPQKPIVHLVTSDELEGATFIDAMIFG